MKGRCYLLSLEEFWEGADGERYFREALHKVDVTRREKVECMRTEKSRAACLGAGLLLQFAVQAAIRESEGEGHSVSAWTTGKMYTQGDRLIRERMLPQDDISSREKVPFQGKLLSRRQEGTEYGLTVYRVSGLLEQLHEVLDLKMYYSENGKPYLQDYSLYFNLSHSGNYAVCAVSPREVGVDIQEQKQVNLERLAKRFFSEEEQSFLKACANEKEQCKLFYQLWTRKEAYGKLTGEGIAAVIDKNMLLIGGREPSVAGTEDDSPLFWQEWELDGYAITLCQYGIK